MNEMPSSSIDISSEAVEALIREEITRDNFLRIIAVPGGCSGVTYQFGIDDQLSSTDRVVFEDDRIRVITDETSFSQVRGLEIRYSDDPYTGGFKLKNPILTSSCSCGSGGCH
jgi:iron-sulfur cluster assembly accessory protein